MSEAKKEPGQVVSEALDTAPGKEWDFVIPPWSYAAAWYRTVCEHVERAVLDHHAPRLATLETEAADLRRQVTTLHANLETERRARESAERDRELLTNRAARKFLESFTAVVTEKMSSAFMRVADLTVLDTPASMHPAGGGGPPRVEVDAPMAERKPPFRDWTDEDRAKLVPGASVQWWQNGHMPSIRIVLYREYNNDTTAVLGRQDGSGRIFHAELHNIDPKTIELPATRKRTPPTVEWRNFRAVDGRVRFDDAPPEASPATQAAPVSLGGVGTGEVRLTQDAPVERPPAPDLREGDIIVHEVTGETIRVSGPPRFIDGIEWWVPFNGGLCQARMLDPETRERVWRPGEVVPHAPSSVGRRIAACVWVRGGHPAFAPTLPLAEPWTQFGVDVPAPADPPRAAAPAWDANAEKNAILSVLRGILTVPPRDADWAGTLKDAVVVVERNQHRPENLRRG